MTVVKNESFDRRWKNGIDLFMKMATDNYFLIDSTKLTVDIRNLSYITVFFCSKSRYLNMQTLIHRARLRSTLRFTRVNYGQTTVTVKSTGYLMCTT